MTDIKQIVVSEGNGSDFVQLDLTNLGDCSYVLKPVITSPSSSAVEQSTSPNIVATAYKNVFADDERETRIFQISTSLDFSAPVREKEVNADTWTVEQQLEADTQYFVRVMDRSVGGLSSPWSDVISFTTGDSQQVNAPTITIKGYNDSTSDFGSGLTIELSEFSTTPGIEDTHQATSYYIDQVTGRAGGHIWESLNNTSEKTGITVPDGTLTKSTRYRLSVIYIGTKLGASAPATVEFTTSADFGTVNVPTLTVEGGPNEVYETPTLTGGAFSNTRDPDTHEMSDWKIVPTAGGDAVWESLNDSSHKTSIVVPEKKLQVSTAYKAMLRYKGTKYGWSEWQETQFTTVDAFTLPSTIGEPGQMGFGVGVCPDEDVLYELGLTPLEGTDDPSSENYGNYQRGGSVFCYIPAFCYKFTGVIGDNQFDIKSASYFNYDQEAMAAENWILHRAFIDGGQVKHGFFISKYIASRGTDGKASVPMSVKNGEIISLCEHTTDHEGNLNTTNSEDMGGNGTHKDVFLLISKIGKPYNCETAFMASALAMLSFCHGKASKDTTVCAWYDSKGITNYPKGCNNGFLKDIDDDSVVYLPTNIAGYFFKTKPLTGSASLFSKITHNGQNCGVADVNGGIDQIVIGVNYTELKEEGDFSKATSFNILKESVALESITYENNLNREFFDNFSYSIPHKSFKWGVPGQDCFFRDKEGVKRGLCGVFPPENGTSDDGTNEFGCDGGHFGYGDYIGVSGNWDHRPHTYAGIFLRQCKSSWAGSGWGFRIAAYGSK